MKGLNIVLAGDYIFDNAAYVIPGRSVAGCLVQQIGLLDRVTLLAEENATIEDVSGQMSGMPNDTTHVIISVGGNDAWGSLWLLDTPAASVKNALEKMCVVADIFRGRYRKMLVALAARDVPLVVCAICNHSPGLSGAQSAALAVFNDVISEEAGRAGIPVIDLRVVLRVAEDFSSASPTGPSHLGSRKIAMAIVNAISPNC